MIFKLFKIILFYLISAAALSQFGDELNSSMSPAYNCNDQITQECPPFLNERTEYLTDRGFWDSRTPAQRCLEREEFRPISQLFAVSARELDSSLHDHSATYNGGILAAYGSSCFEGRRGEITDLTQRFELINERCTNNSGLPQSCSAVTEAAMAHEIEPNVRVADNYLSHLKLRSAQEEALRSINSIGSLLGESTAMDIECSSVGYSQTQQLCQTLKTDQCQLRAQATEARAGHLSFTKEVLKSYRAIELEKHQLMSDSSGIQGMALASRQEEVRENMDRYQELDDHLNDLMARVPWITGEAFKEHLNFNSRAFNRLFDDDNETEFNRLVEQGFDAQMRSNRDNLTSQVRDYTVAANCLRGSGNCEEDDFRETLALTPNVDLENINLASPHKSQLAFAQCMNQDAMERDDRTGLVSSIVIGTGLTVASIFVPPLGIARAVQFGNAAIRAGQGIRTAASLAGRNLNRAPMSFGFLMGDAAYLGAGVADAVGVCAEGERNDIEFENSAVPLESAPRCTDEGIRLQTRYQNIPSGCAASVMFAGLEAAPFGALGIRRFNELRRLRIQNTRLDIPLNSPLAGARRNEFFDQHVLDHYQPQSAQQIQETIEGHLQVSFNRNLETISNITPNDMTTRITSFRQRGATLGISEDEINNAVEALVAFRNGGAEPPLWAVAIFSRRATDKHFRSFDGIGWRTGRDTSFFPEGVNEQDLFNLPARSLRASPEQRGLPGGSIAYDSEINGNQYRVVVCRSASGCRDIDGSGGSVGENDIISAFPVCGDDIFQALAPHNYLTELINSRTVQASQAPNLLRTGCRN